MNELNDRQWNMELGRVIEMADYSHEDYEVEDKLADLWFTIMKGHIWDLPKMMWKGWKLAGATQLHEKCCDLK